MDCINLMANVTGLFLVLVNLNLKAGGMKQMYSVFLMAMLLVVTAVQVTQAADNASLNKAMAITGEQLWTGNGNGVILWNITDFTSEFFDKRNKLESNDVRSIILATDGVAWIATYGGGISCCNDGKWTSYTKDNGLHSEKVTCLIEGNDGTIWAGTDDGLMRFKDDEWKLFTVKQGMLHNTVTALAMSSKGILWVGSSIGLMQYDGAEWLPFHASSTGLISDNIQCITIDKSDNLWIGLGEDTNGNSGGLNMFNGATSWQRYDISDGLCSDDVRAVGIDNDGDRWIGTDAGLARFDLRDWTCYSANDGLISDDVASIVIDDKGHIWFGASGCITMFDGINWSTYKTSE